ncbi:MAG: SLATT domain-containing protein, partial [Chloroflexota bacterium]
MANPQQSPADNGTRTQSAADTANAAHLEAEMADKLTRIYWERRVQYQLDYYQKRAREYELNVDSAFRMGAILMTISSLLASLGIVVSDDDIWAPMISLLTAIIPAIVSYIAAFRQLYQWDRQLSLYRDTQLNLERAKLVIPDLSSIAKEDAPVHFPALVQEVENVLQQEISQWGQIARGEGDEEGDAERDLDATLRAFLTTTDGEVDEDQLQELTAMVKNAKETPRAGQFRQTEEDLNTNFFDGERQRRERIRAQQQEVQNLANAASQRTPTTTPE